MQRLQVIGDVRIDDALEIEVCEQNERAATGGRLRWELQVGFAKEAENVAAEAVTQGSQRALGFGAQHALELQDDPIASCASSRRQ